jgi:hydrogenase/urease accessory protein HupE
MRMFITLCLLLGAPLAWAHKPSDSYLDMRPQGKVIEVKWDIALRDLEIAVGLDTNGDRAITWGEVRAQQPELERYLLPKLTMRAGELPCRIDAGPFQIERLSDGVYVSLALTSTCPQAGPFTIEDTLLFDLDTTHRSLVTWHDANGVRTLVLTPEQHRATLSSQPRNRLFEFGRMINEGVWHIWQGFDHLMFLIALLLPLGVARSSGGQPRWRQAVRHVAGVVTAFTIAHSLTLSLAALKLVSLPVRLIETSIAISIVVAGLMLVLSKSHSRTGVAFAFGLIHGFGFANVLADMNLPRSELVQSLLGFNLGVEIGQGVIVATVLPILLWARSTRRYETVAIPVAATCIAVVGLAWAIERAFAIDLASWASSMLASL